MKHTLPIAFLLLAACQSTGAPPVDENARKELFTAVSALEGTWQRSDPTGALSTTRFAISSGGSVVIETMFPGTEHEMTNVYSLDGDSLVMTHYCAMGNQPRMRSKGLKDGRIDFTYVDATNLKSPDEHRMTRAVFSFPDASHLVQDWTSKEGGKDVVSHFEFSRTK